MFRKILRGSAAPLAALALWQLLSLWGVINVHVLPSPGEVTKRWMAYLLPLEARDPAAMSWLQWAMSGELPQDVWASLYRVAAGFFLGAGLALPVGLVMGYSRIAHGFLNPIVQILRPIPPIAYIPLAILWFGLGNPPAVFLISIGAFFPVLMNTVAGVQNVDRIYLRAAKNLGAGRGTTFLRVILPAAMPYIFAGARIGIGTAFIVVIVSEMIAVNNGLGFRILEAREYMWSGKIIAGMFTIGLLGLGIDLLVSRLADRLLRWHQGLES